MGFRSGASSPCVFFHPERNVSIVVHGDDFNALGTSADLDWYEKCLADNFEIKVRGRMGPGGDCTEIKILNRILTYSEKGLTYEADPRHIDLLSSSMGLTAANSLSTPGVKDPEPNYSAIINDEDPAPPMSPCVDGGAVAAVMSEHVSGDRTQPRIRTAFKSGTGTRARHVVRFNDSLVHTHPLSRQPSMVFSLLRVEVIHSPASQSV